ncbi:hypothetical protein PV708_04765 [Streptomyces sp. ME02-6977A]|uniref:hypothetical protein n=1 Tax=Streptomyces sp. ME02-6977A TaxID=3028671 RepID=UPI00299FC6E4|nr:hypothetical protein [Streptomyces sp. ME02-6977A]MDX3405537.1 hypothetical protein [Streptomyces sp. ME02-6977A]
MPAISPDQAARRRRTNAKILKFGCLPLAAIFVLVIVLAAVGSNQDDDKPAKEATVNAPAYTVTNKQEKTKTGSVDLVVPDATVDTAKAAIEDYAQGIGDSFQDYAITVVRSDTDKVYVCSGRWIRDEQASELYTGGKVKADSWPAIDMNCPDPKG